MIVGLAASNSIAPGTGSPNPINVTLFKIDQYSTTEEEEDSDDGTVYADTKDELTDDKLATLRPDSSLSDVSNSHTDNTLKSVESIPDRANSELLNNSTTSSPHSLPDTGPVTESDISYSANQEQTSCPVIMRINSATSSESSDSENILNSLEGNGKNNKRDTYSMANIMSAAAGQVEKAVNAAMSIIKQDKAESSGRPVTTNEGPNANVVDCDTIEVDFTSDSDHTPLSLGYHSAETRCHKSVHDEEIDDSDEADALSASSLD